MKYKKGCFTVKVKHPFFINKLSFDTINYLLGSFINTLNSGRHAEKKRL